MSSILSERQKQDMNGAILEYFLANEGKFTKSIAALREEGGLPDTVNSGKALLEKKWSSVIRLQKRVMELEAKLASSTSSQSSGKDVPALDNPLRTIPKGPARASLTGHRAPVTCLSLHPSYNMVGSGSEDMSIRLWDLDTNQFERTLKGHTGPVTAVAFDATGQWFASCSTDMTAKIWDLKTYNCSKTLRGHDHTISSVVFTQSGDNLITCSRDHTIKFWEVASGYCTKTLSGHSDWVRCMSMGLNGEYLASGGSDQTILVWNMANGQIAQTLRGHEHVVESLSYGRKPILVASLEGSTNALPAPPTAGAMSDDSIQPSGKSSGVSDSFEYSYLASGSRDRTVKLWDPLKGVCLMNFPHHENWVRSVVFHASGKYILSCSDDRSMRVMDIKENRCCRTIENAHSHFVTCLTATSATRAQNSSSGFVVVSGSVDKLLNVWGCT